MPLVKFKSAHIINRPNGTLTAKLTGTPGDASMPYIFSGTITALKLDKSGHILEIKTDEVTYKKDA